MKELIFCLLIFLVPISVLGELCENADFDHGDDIWIRRFNITAGYSAVTQPFLIKITYRPRITDPGTELGDVEAMFGSKAVNPFLHLVSMYKTKQLQPFRQTNFIWNFQFLHGDMAVIHLLDPKNGEYSRVELGGHSLQYAVFIKPGVYFSVDIDTHTEEKFILLGIVPVRASKAKSEFGFVPRKRLLTEFPQHANLINGLYDRASVLPQFS